MSVFLFSSRRRHTRFDCDWSSDVCSSDLGDTVRVYVRVVEGEKERTQLFEGIVIRRRGEGARASFTVRRISYGVGVERTFPLHSPRIERVEVVRRSRVRRSKLYYLRGLAGKAARLKEKRAVLIPTTTEAE